MNVFEAVAANWHPASAYNFALSRDEDYGVILLEVPVPRIDGPQVFPLRACWTTSKSRGGLGSGSLCDSVGYGVVARPSSAGPAPVRRASRRTDVLASRASLGLTRSELGLLGNAGRRLRRRVLRRLRRPGPAGAAPTPRSAMHGRRRRAVPGARPRPTRLDVPGGAGVLQTTTCRLP